MEKSKTSQLERALHGAKGGSRAQLPPVWGGCGGFHARREALDEAVTSRTDTVIDGLPVPAAARTKSEDDHQKLRIWLWTVLLADGARALTSAGRWHDAHTHLQQHRGIGRRMLDGRHRLHSPVNRVPHAPRAHCHRRGRRHEAPCR